MQVVSQGTFHCFLAKFQQVEELKIVLGPVSTVTHARHEAQACIITVQSPKQRWSAATLLGVAGLKQATIEYLFVKQLSRISDIVVCSPESCVFPFYACLVALSFDSPTRPSKKLGDQKLVDG